MRDKGRGAFSYAGLVVAVAVPPLLQKLIEHILASRHPANPNETGAVSHSSRGSGGDTSLFALDFRNNSA